MVRALSARIARPEREVQEVARGEQREQRHCPDQIVERAAVPETHAQQRQGRDLRDAGIFSEPFQIPEEKVDGYPPCDGAERQVVTGEPQGDEAKKQRDDGGKRDCCRQAEPRRHIIAGGEHGRGICADADECGLPERHLSGHAREQNEPERNDAGEPGIVEERHVEFRQDEGSDRSGGARPQASGCAGSWLLFLLDPPCRE